LLLSSCQATEVAQVANILLSNPTTQNAALAALTNQDITAAFKQALTIGTGEVVNQLGTTNGFALDPKVHIPLPNSLAKVQNVLNAAGMSFLLDDLETRMNRAAEIATPHAKELFVHARCKSRFNKLCFG